MCKEQIPTPAAEAEPEPATAWGDLTSAAPSESPRRRKEHPRPPDLRWVLGLSLGGLALLVVTVLGLLFVFSSSTAKPTPAPVVAQNDPPKVEVPKPTPMPMPTPIPMPNPVAPVRFTIEVTPPEAEVVAEGQGATLTGTGRQRKLEIAAAKGTVVTVTAKLAGYRPAAQPIVAGLETQTTHALKLVALPAVIVVTLDPPDAEIALVGKGATMAGEGRQREITVEDPTRPVTVQVQRAEYETIERSLTAKPGVKHEVELKLSKPVFVAAPMDNVEYLRVQFSPQHRFGITLTRERKQITYSPDGGTNNTCVHINGQQTLFSGEGQPAAYTEDGISGWRSKQNYLNNALTISQDVSIRRGEVSGKLDTCLIGYLIENKDTRAHRVGLRFMLDTLIGGNDGVPFTIPGRPGLCNTIFQARLPNRLPDYLQALENPSLTQPGTIAHLTIKVPDPEKKLEPPSELMLTYWPGEDAGWGIPLNPISSDSAVVLYWSVKPMQPGEKRHLAFAYGLGALASSEGGGNLALTFGGAFQKGGEFTVVAYVNKPTMGQTVTIELPKGLVLAEGSGPLKQTVVASMASPVSQVSWRVKSEDEGKYNIKASMSNGPSQTKEITIRKE